MAAYSATNGLVAFDDEKQTDHTERPKYVTLLYDPIEVTARYTRVALEKQILDIVKIVTRPRIRRRLAILGEDPGKNYIDPCCTYLKYSTFDQTGCSGHKETALYLLELDGCSICLNEGLTSDKNHHRTNHGETEITRQCIKRRGGDNAPYHQLRVFMDNGEEAIGIFVKKTVAAIENEIKNKNGYLK
ncbi:hypothetical protein EVAR_50038_1 [Eumeta japonica]|uniref:Uncharacterized protein n=1 Tax=Eumeta variegata TaxID=151549 RepID=A0A4C1XJB1_EUMVA|nr:hypothetical protein EVAR_50038_1 [Eumeta japonica]